MVLRTDGTVPHVEELRRRDRRSGALPQVLHRSTERPDERGDSKDAVVQARRHLREGPVSRERAYPVLGQEQLQVRRLPEVPGILQACRRPEILRRLHRAPERPLALSRQPVRGAEGILRRVLPVHLRAIRTVRGCRISFRT